MFHVGVSNHFERFICRGISPSKKYLNKSSDLTSKNFVKENIKSDTYKQPQMHIQIVVFQISSLILVAQVLNYVMLLPILIEFSAAGNCLHC